MRVDGEQLADFGFYLSSEACYNLPRIETLAREEGLNPHGFGGPPSLLAPLGEIIKGKPPVLVGEAFNVMQRKLCELGDSLIAAARHYNYVDEDNRSLIERNGIDIDGTGINVGSGYGKGDGYDRHRDDGSSNFKYADLEISPIDRPDTNYADEIEYGPVLDVLDWIWRQFSDKGFIDDMVSPLAGNYNSINASGEAWKSVGKNLGLVAGAMGDNASTLAANHWEGDAAEAFERFFDVYWKKGAVFAGEKLGEFVAKGFEKVADASKRIAEEAVEKINKLVDIATKKIASKLAGLPIGVVVTLVEYVLDWLGIDVDTLHEAAQQIWNLAQSIHRLFELVEEIVKDMEEYFLMVQELVDVVKKIPEIDSVDDAVSTANTIDQNLGKLEEQKAKVEKNLKEAEGALGEVDKHVTEATAG